MHRANQERIAIDDPDPANPCELRFSLESYVVPGGGGEVREFEKSGKTKG